MVLHNVNLTDVFNRQAFVTCNGFDTTPPPLEYHFQTLAIGLKNALHKALWLSATSGSQALRDEMRIRLHSAAGKQGAKK